MAKAKIQFENPPGLNRGRHAEIAEQLKANPKKWAIVTTHATPQASSAMAQQIRTGYLSSYRPKGHFEAMARTVDKQYRVYARYIGEEKDE